MGFFDKLWAWLSFTPGTDSPPPERGPMRQYDNVRIMKPDGTTIEGHDAVKGHFDEEQRLLDEHGSTITFQVYRVDPGAKSLQELQGDKRAEIAVNDDFVSGDDTVADAKRKLRSLVQGQLRPVREPGARPELNIEETERMSFYFGGRPMADDKLFYAEHFMMLPVWVQVLLHYCDHDEIDEAIRRLAQESQPRGSAP